jgi:GntR family transcriptional regulator
MSRKSNRRVAAVTNALARENARPLHEQLSGRLRAELLFAYRAGDQIPTEEAIGSTYGLSRVTVRRAMQTLVDQGVLIRRQGKGTFLAPPKPRITCEIDRLGPFMAAFAASKENVSVRLAEFTWASGEQVPANFNGHDSALIYNRIYETDGAPLASLQIALPGRLGEKVSRGDASKMGIYQILQEKLGVIPWRANFLISSELPDPKLAERLRVSPTTPLLVLERVSFDKNDKVIEQTVHHLLPEVYKLSVKVKRMNAK